MKETKTTKYCKICNQEKPVSEFGKCSKAVDGLYYYCKECTNRLQRERAAKGHLKKVYSNPDLASFHPRELIAELKARRYSGELTYT